MGYSKRELQMKTIRQKFKQLEKHYSDNLLAYKIYWPETPKSYENKEKGAFRIESQLQGIMSGIKKLDLPPNSKILDICCGLPILLTEIKKEFPKFKLYGIDVYTNEIANFEEYNKDCEIFKFPFQMLFDETYRDNMDFDLIIMINSFRAFEDEDKENILAWSKNNGKLFMHDIQGGTEVIQ
jgi:ubiquinone/menaquinone biosynthesis C-methylase UbiE